MEVKANRKRRELEFSIGDNVLVKLQPYRQLTLAKRASNKVAKRYYRPFEVVERVGKVAYRLALHVDSKIHPVIHVSLLKLFSGSDTFKVTLIPEGSTEGHPVEQLVAICGTRAVLRGGRMKQQVLVQWAGRSFLKEGEMIRQLFENLGARQGRQSHRGANYRYLPNRVVSIGAFIDLMDEQIVWGWLKEQQDRAETLAQQQAEAFQLQSDALHADLQATRGLLIGRPPGGGGGGGEHGLITRSMRLDVPKFTGADPDAWLFAIQEYFTLLNTPADQRLRIVGFNLEGAAAEWFFWMSRNGLITDWGRQSLQLPYDRQSNLHIASPFVCSNLNLSICIVSSVVEIAAKSFLAWVGKLVKSSFLARIDETLLLEIKIYLLCQRACQLSKPTKHGQ
ncbi:hypothetical protein Tco_0570313 [Tanacetum coccineum]